MSRSDQINAWANRVFGVMRDPMSSVNRALKEFVELQEAIVNEKDPSEIAEEAADVVINLHRLVGSLGLDLDQSVDTKMTLNHARKWESDGHGQGQHIKSEDERKGLKESLYAIGIEKDGNSVGMIYGPTINRSEALSYLPFGEVERLLEGERIVLYQATRGRDFQSWKPAYQWSKSLGEWIVCSG